MSSSDGITLTPEETRLFGQLFQKYDSEGMGVILGDAARPLFERSGLSAKTLGQIWTQADANNRGFLDFQGFSKALRLIAHVQNGQQLSRRLITIPSGVPNFERPPATASQPTSPTAPVAPGAIPVQSTQQSTATAPTTGANAVSLPAPVQGSGAIPPLQPAEQTRFGALFDRSAKNGFLEGPDAREIFLKARLPTDALGKIWNLVDIHSRGSLSRNEFLLAMHLIQGTINNSLPSIPTSLAPQWVSWLEGQSPAPTSNRSTSVSGNIVANSTGGSVASFATGIPATNWTITPQQKAQYDGYFDSLDTQKAGVIGAQEVVPFLTRSRLSEEVLAQVWDLADINGQGQLGKTEFALAMYFVQAKLSGAELPESLPKSLLDSVHNLSNGQQAAQRTGSVVSPPPAPATRQAPLQSQNTASSLTDLAGLDDTFFKSNNANRVASPALQPTRATQSREASISQAPVQAQAQQAQAQAPTASAAQPQPQQSTTGTQRTVSPSQETRDLRFVPLSTFGQSLVGQGSTGEVQKAQGEVADLSKQVDDLRNQYSSTALQGKQLDEELASVLEKKKQLEAEIRGLRERYDAEATRVHKTQAQIKTTTDEIKQLEKSHTLRESGLKALQSQYEQDKGSHEELRKRKEELETGISSLEEQHNTHNSNLESLHSESEHLRGQVDGHQKQISSMETELQSIYEQIEAAKLHRDDTSNKAREAKERSDRLAAEVVAAQQEHRDILAETERHAAAHAAALEQAASIEQSRPAVPSAPTSTSSHGIATGAVAGGLAGGAIGTAAAVLTEGGLNRGHYNHESSISTHQASTIYSAHSSPPTSEFPTGYGDQQNQIPSFTLPMARPESATSSVANNPPQSVRGDVDVSQPESPAFSTSEPVSGLVPPETLNIGRSPDIVPSSDNDSFEFVDAYDGEEPEPETETEGAGHVHVPPPIENSTAPSSEGLPEEATLRGSAQRGPEFPPIRDLEIDDDSSDEDVFDRPEAVSEPTQHVFSYGDEAGVSSHPGSDSVFDRKVAVDPYTSAAVANASGPSAADPLEHIYNYDGHRAAQAPAAAVESSQAENVFNSYGQPSTSSSASVPGSETGTRNSIRSVPAAQPKDEFGDAFDDLEEAQEDTYISEDDAEAFEGFGNSTHAATQGTGFPETAPAVSNSATGPDEWQQLFADTKPAQSEVPAVAASGAIPQTGNDAALHELTSMGFDRDAALAALQRANYNVSEATNILLDA